MNLATNTQQPAPARITLPRDHPDVQAAERAGFDLCLIEDNLNLPPVQRAIQHDRALALVLELDRQREKLYAHAQPTHTPAS
jgi:hypothetical protein